MSCKELNEPRWETGCDFWQYGTADTEGYENVISRVDNGKQKKLGSRVVEQAI